MNFVILVGHPKPHSELVFRISILYGSWKNTDLTFDSFNDSDSLLLLQSIQ